MKPWLIETNLAPSFAIETKLDDQLKRELVKDTFRLLGVSHRERVRKINKKKEDLQRRIVERTSYKESLQRKKEELEKIMKKKETFEKKNMGGYKYAYPSQNPEKQEMYEKYIHASNNPMPFPGTKINSSVSGGPKKAKDRNSSTMPKLKKGSLSEKAGKISKAKEVIRAKATKSPYEAGVKRMVTPLSQKRKRSGYKSNPKQM